jgi:hypothetical protein
MIEKYFVKGARFKWNAPGAVANQVRDGSIVVNPPSPPGTMTYVGLDGEIVDWGMPNVTTLGFQMNMTISHSWLSYVLGRTAKISTNNDVLTGFMSGCLITTWTDGTGRWVGHVGTVESAGKDQPPNSDVKLTFSQAMPANTRGFNPAAAWGPEDLMPLVQASKTPISAKVVALVTGSGQFYAVAMLNRMNEPGVWVCGGKKAVAGMDVHGLATALAVTRPRR